MLSSIPALRSLTKTSKVRALLARNRNNPRETPPEPEGVARAFSEAKRNEEMPIRKKRAEAENKRARILENQERNS